MLEGLEEAVAASAPLVIREIQYNDPVLALIGPDSSLALACPGTLSAAGRAMAGLGLQPKAIDLDA